MAAIHVKPGMNEGECYDSIEFSPFEVGFAKYGVSMKTEQFHCRFYAGKVVSKYPEPPLKHLHSVFGSAHTIDMKYFVPELFDMEGKGVKAKSNMTNLKKSIDQLSCMVKQFA